MEVTRLKFHTNGTNVQSTVSERSLTLGHRDEVYQAYIEHKVSNKDDLVKDAIWRLEHYGAETLVHNHVADLTSTTCTYQCELFVRTWHNHDRFAGFQQVLVLSCDGEPMCGDGNG